MYDKKTLDKVDYDRLILLTTKMVHQLFDLPDVDLLEVAATCAAASDLLKKLEGPDALRRVPEHG
ncbi:MAG TPA: hypothetical protein VGN16_09295 [Acidobacteriaceae bacterium]|jgi:hypothetical protein